MAIANSASAEDATGGADAPADPNAAELALLGSEAMAGRLSEDLRAVIRRVVASGDLQATALLLQALREIAPVEATPAEAPVVASLPASGPVPEPAIAAEARLGMQMSGSVEFGGFQTAGTVAMVGVFGAAKMSLREGRWRHDLAASGDLQKTNGAVSNERFVASWQPRFDTDSDRYTFGIVEYDHAPLAGYEHRYTLGAGLGVHVRRTAKTALELQGGPAARMAVSADGQETVEVAVRGGVNMRWALADNLAFVQATAVYLESEDSSVVSNSNLDITVVQPLSLKLSYSLQYESEPLAGRSDVNTHARATLAWKF